MNKETTYTALLPQITALIKGESNETSVLANVAAALHQAFDQFFLDGFLPTSPRWHVAFRPLSRSAGLLCHRHW